MSTPTAPVLSAAPLTRPTWGGSQPASVKPGFLSRLWSGLADYGQRRASTEVARHARLRGLYASGDIAADAGRLAAHRGLR